MSELKSPSLEYYIKSLPLKETEVAIGLAQALEDDPEDFDNFIFSLAQYVDFRKISPLIYLIRLTQLPIDQPFLKEINEKTFNYLSILFQIPESLDETYTRGRLEFDLSEYLLYESYSVDWYNKLISVFDNIEESTNSILANTFVRISEIISYEFILTCTTNLTKLKNLIVPLRVRREISMSPKFFDFIFNIFSQSVFAHDNYENFKKFFEVENLDNLTKYTIDRLDTGLAPYRSCISSILELFLYSGTKDNTLKMIQKCIDYMKIINKSSFAFTKSSQARKVEAFSLNFEYVIVHFVLKLKSKFSDINLYYPYMADSLSPVTNETITMSKIDETTESEFDSIVKKLNEEKVEQNPVTRFFFFAYQCLETCTCSLIRLIDMISERIYRHKEAINRGALNPAQSMFVQREIVTLETNRNLIYAYLLVPSRTNEINALFDYTLKFLVFWSGIKGQTIPEKPNIGFAHLPDYIIGAISMILNMHIVNHLIYDPLPYLKDLVLLFSNRVFIERQEYKHNIIRIFSSLSQDKENSHLTIAVSHIEELMFPAVLQFYCDVQVTDHLNNENYDRLIYRDSCAALLVYWFQFQEFRDYFIAHLSAKFIKDFIFYLVDGAMYFSDHSLDLIRDIYNNAQDSNDPAAVSENQLHMSNLMYWLRNCTHSFNLMNSIVRFCPTAYDDSIIMDKVTKTTLSFVNLFANHQEYLRVVLAQNPNINSYSLLVSVIRFTLGCASNKSFIDSLLGNQMYKVEQIIPKVIDYLKMVQPGENYSLIESLKQLELLIQNRKVEFDKEIINYDDAPDEFFDELTYDLMNVPMKLPSGHHLDIETLKTHLLNKKEDPFTMTPLKFEDCVVDTELKQKIDEYIRKKKEEK